MVLAPIMDGSYFKMVLFSFECLSSLITILIFFHLFYQIYGKDLLISIGILKKSLNDTLKIKTTKLFSTMSVFFYMITTIFIALHHSTSSNLYFFTDLTIIISDLTWTIGQTSCYLLIITRLYWTFEGSVHQSSNIFFYILITLAIIFALSMSSAQILFIYDTLKHITFIYYAIISIIVCIIDLILSTIIIYTFLYKLHDLTIHCQNNWISKPNSDYTNDIKQIKMIKAECNHFKNEKKAFKKKLKQKTHKAKKKGIVIPSSKRCEQHTHRKDSIKTHSRILNDISTSPTDTETLIKPSLQTTNSTLISNIIDTNTTMTFEDLNNKNILLYKPKSNSVWDGDEYKPKSSISLSSNSYKKFKKIKSKSVANGDEYKFNYRIEPKLVEMENVEINNKFSISQTVKGNDINNGLPYSIDSIYNPLNPEIMNNNSNSDNSSADTIKVNNKYKDTISMNTISKPSTDFAMIDIFDEMKQRSGRDTNSTTVTNATVTDSATNTLFSVQTDSGTVNDKNNILNHQQFEEIIRTQSVFDKYKQNLSLDDRQKLLVIVMVKYTILAILAVISTQIFVIMGVIATLLTYNLSNNNNSNNKLNIINGIYYFIWCINCVIASLCCYLNFKMNDQLYYKLCMCCNRKCKQICMEISKNKMVNAKIDDRAQTLHQYLLNNNDKNGNKKRKY